MLRALWHQRSIVLSLVHREFQLRSVRAVWGSLWLVLQPAFQIFIYTVVFSQVLRAKLPGAGDSMAYGFYVCAGLISWNFFAEIVDRGRTLFLDHADLLKSMQFPRSVLPAALVLSCSLNFAIVASILLIVLFATGRWPGVVLLEAVPLLILQSMLAIGLGVLAGTLHVFFRDVGKVVELALQLWFWLTPIVYPISIIPARLRTFFNWNPMLHIVEGYQRIVIEHAAPHFETLGSAFATALTSVLAAWWVFRRLSPDLVDEL